MAGKSSKTPITHRDLDGFVRNSDEPEDICELIFGFIDEGIEFQSCENSLESKISYSSGGILVDEEEEDGNVNNSEENKEFWASQEELLKVKSLNLKYNFCFWYFDQIFALPIKFHI